MGAATYAAASNLATLRFDQGEYTGAVRALEKAVALDDRDYRVWRFLASAYHWAPGEREKATQAYRRAAELAERHLTVNPRDATGLVALADCRATLGEDARGRQLVEKALALAPEDVEVMQTAGEVYEVLGDRARALQWIHRALEKGYSAGRIERTPALAELRADPRYRGGLRGATAAGTTKTADKEGR